MTKHKLGDLIDIKNYPAGVTIGVALFQPKRGIYIMNSGYCCSVADWHFDLWYIEDNSQCYRL